MSKIVLAGIFVVLIIAAAGFFIFKSFTAENQQDTIPVVIEEPYQATLTGEHICLQSAGISTTTECASGMRTDANEYYSVIFNVASEENIALEIGDRFTASGLVTPLSHISTDQWQYPLKGIFSITGSVQLETQLEETQAPETTE